MTLYSADSNNVKLRTGSPKTV